MRLLYKQTSCSASGRRGSNVLCGEESPCPLKAKGRLVPLTTLLASTKRSTEQFPRSLREQRRRTTGSLSAFKIKPWLPSAGQAHVTLVLFSDMLPMCKCSFAIQSISRREMFVKHMSNYIMSQVLDTLCFDRSCVENVTKQL